VTALGYLMATQPVIGMGSAAAVLGILAPRWTLLATAIVAQDVIPRTLIIGPFLLSDLALLLFVSRWAAGRTLGIDREPLTRPWHLWLFAFVGWAWLSLFLVDAPTATALERVTLYAAVFVAASTDRRLAKPVLIFLALYSAFQAVASLAGFTSHLGSRLLGFNGDPGVYGTLMLAGIAGSMVLPTKARFLTIPPAAIAAALTLTRATWVAGIVQAGLIVWPRHRRRQMVIGALVGIAVALAFWLAPVVTERFDLNPTSVELRVTSWHTALDLIESDPFLGHGWDVGGRSGRAAAPYNLWLNTAASTGILGAVLITGFLAMVLRELVRSSDPVAHVGVIYLAGFIVLSLQSMTINATGNRTIMFFTVTGSCVALARKRGSGHPNGASARAGPQPVREPLDPRLILPAGR
jgi:O-antigen ligase